ncbi:MAG: succinyldiaminopimelate transaminase [Burkholderiales bacterium]|nr:MAG: succinyldiaminopimelate transaminase [Burkholderiales bacterium]
MNPLLDLLHPYPFERLRTLLADVVPNPDYDPINLSIGEPKHPTPSLVTEALVAGLDGLSVYPATAGSMPMREALSGWLARRYGIPAPDPGSTVLPVNGSREALFAFAQAVIDPGAGGWVLCPNPFYQIYEGAAVLAGARPWYVAQRADDGFRCRWEAIDESVWAETRLVYVCSPGNPTGRVMDLQEWRLLFERSDRHGFVIAADECYSEIYFDTPPLGALQAARRLGRDGYDRLVVFGSLSKRSSVPGMRSGYVAGDPGILRRFLLYRTYHGSAMSLAVQAASIAAWGDEAHVIDNRARYAAKFEAVTPVVSEALQTQRPEAGFYLWARVPGRDDAAFARELQRQYNVLVLPGSFLARTHEGANPGAGFVRIALVEGLEACRRGAQRIVEFASEYR